MKTLKKPANTALKFEISLNYKNISSITNAYNHNFFLN